MEVLVEFLEVLKDLLHVTGWVNQVGDAEVVSALLLSETRAWHRHNSSFVNHLKAVNEVRCLALLFSLVDKLLTEVDLWEAVHGAFDLRTSYLLHVVEGPSEEFRSFF